MKFFLDENFPKAAQALLLTRSHSVFDIRGTADEGATDEEIFQMTLARKAVFLSTDRDFFHTIPHLYTDHFGIVVIALRQPNRDAILSRLSWFLDNFDESSMVGRAYLLREHACTIYPASE